MTNALDKLRSRAPKPAGTVQAMADRAKLKASLKVKAEALTDEQLAAHLVELGFTPNPEADASRDFLVMTLVNLWAAADSPMPGSEKAAAPEQEMTVLGEKLGPPIEESFLDEPEPELASFPSGRRMLALLDVDQIPDDKFKVESEIVRVVSQIAHASRDIPKGLAPEDPFDLQRLSGTVFFRTLKDMAQHEKLDEIDALDGQRPADLEGPAIDSALVKARHEWMMKTLEEAAALAEPTQPDDTGTAAPPEQAVGIPCPFCDDGKIPHEETPNILVPCPYCGGTSTAPFSAERVKELVKSLPSMRGAFLEELRNEIGRLGDVAGSTDGFKRRWYMNRYKRAAACWAIRQILDDASGAIPPFGGETRTLEDPEILADDDRCERRFNDDGPRCVLERGHDGACTYDGLDLEKPDDPEEMLEPADSTDDAEPTTGVEKAARNIVDEARHLVLAIDEAKDTWVIAKENASDAKKEFERAQERLVELIRDADIKQGRLFASGAA